MKFLPYVVALLITCTSFSQTLTYDTVMFPDYSQEYDDVTMITKGIGLDIYSGDTLVFELNFDKLIHDEFDGEGEVYVIVVDPDNNEYILHFNEEYTYASITNVESRKTIEFYNSNDI